MRAWAIFCYGVAGGILTVWMVDAVFDSFHANWLLIGAAAVLGIGLITHQRHISLNRGRRWRRTVT